MDITDDKAKEVQDLGDQLEDLKVKIPARVSPPPRPEKKEGKKSPTVLELLIQQDLEAVFRKGINPNTGFYLVDGRAGNYTQSSDKMHGLKGVVLNRSSYPKRKS